MSHEVFHRLVGYDRLTKHVAVEHEVPAGYVLDYVKNVAQIDRETDPDAALCYRLSSSQADRIAHAIGVKINAEKTNFYLEGFSEPLARRA